MATKKKGSRSRRRPPPRPSSGSSAKPSSQPATTSTKAPSSQPATKAAAKPVAAKAGAAVTSPPKAPRTNPTRTERIEAARRARRRKAVLIRVAIVGTVVAVLAVISFVMVSNRQSRNRTIASMETGSCKYDEKSDEDAGQGRNHVPSPTFVVNPPSGGDHDASPSPAGVYSVDNLPPDGKVVHSLEHGYVIIWYQPDIGEPALNELKAVTDKYRKDVLLVPRQSLPTPVAATAWHRRLLCEGPEAQALETFVSSFRNEGPEKIPHP